MKKPNNQLPEEIRKIFREYGKKGGRPRQYDDEEHKKNRERVKAYRQRQKEKNNATEKNDQEDRMETV